MLFHVGLMRGQCSLMTGVVSCRSNVGPVLTDDWCCVSCRSNVGPVLTDDWCCVSCRSNVGPELTDDWCCFM